MIFKPPPWIPPSSFNPASIPDSIPIPEFIFSHAQHKGSDYRPFICGHTSKSYSFPEVEQRVTFLSRALAHNLNWHPNKGSEWDKVVAVFSVNSIDTLPLYWAVHRLSGVVTPVNAVYGVDELVYQLKASRAKVLVTCRGLLGVALDAIKKLRDSGEGLIDDGRVYVLDSAVSEDENSAARRETKKFKTVNELIDEGSRLSPLEKLRWEKGQGARQCAFLCYSSGTSGLPKGVMVSHVNVIAHVLMVFAFDLPTRSPGRRDVILGLLPQSHIYGLVVISHDGVYRGDSIVVLPKFELKLLLESIQRYKINVLIMVPPTIIILKNNKAILDKYDLTSVREVYSGAAPLGPETASQIQEQHPKWIIRGIYGLTESTAVISHTSTSDVLYGSCGSLLPGYVARLIAPDGTEVHDYDQPGELVVKGPTVVLGYLNNDAATKETFTDDGWLRTGDEAVIRKSEKGYEHVFVVDRIKELIKVKGHQVAPAELESHLLTHPRVADVAVIPVPDEASGEVPKAFVVREVGDDGGTESEEQLRADIVGFVEKHKARYKWLKGGVEFVREVPKSPSGKILRRLLRDKERDARRRAGAKL